MWHGRKMFWRGLVVVVGVGLGMAATTGWAGDDEPASGKTEQKTTLVCGTETTLITNNRSTAMKGRVKMLVTAADGYDVGGTATSMGPGNEMKVLCVRRSTDRPQEGECAIELPASSKLVLACDGPEGGCGEKNDQILCIFNTTLED